MRQQVFKFVFSAIFIFGLQLNPSNGSEISDPEKITQLIQVYDANVKYVAPSWIKPGNYGNQSKYHRDQKGNLFIFEQVPSKEGFNNWKRLFAVMGLKQKSNASASFEKFINLGFYEFLKICGKQNFRLQPIDQKYNSKTFMMLCGDSPNASGKHGFGKGVGEVGLFKFFHHKNTLVKVYQEWRGNSFKINDSRTWPVSEAEFHVMFNRFKKVEVLPSN